MRIIDDEFALPAAERNGALDYVRSASDPHFMIAGGSGEVYTRRDGAEWEWPGYTIRTDEQRVTREARFSYPPGDANTHFPPTVTAKGTAKIDAPVLRAKKDAAKR